MKSWKLGRFKVLEQKGFFEVVLTHEGGEFVLSGADGEARRFASFKEAFGMAVAANSARVKSVSGEEVVLGGRK